MAFECSWRADGVLIVTGELDLHTAPDLVRTAAEAMNRGPSQLVIDVSELTFMDCSGMTALLATRRRGASVGIKVTLSGASGRVQKLLRMTGVEGLFAADTRTIDLASEKESALGA